MNQPFHCAKNIGSILKTLTVMIGLSGLFMAARGQLLNYEFTNFSMGTTGSLSFTTNNFTSVGVGAENRIWAGSQYGGLYYMDDDGISTWLKSEMLTNVFINDMDTDPNGGLWIAQSGTQSSGGNSNLGGALHYLPTKYAVDMKLYTIPGPVNDANLFSRNVRSVYVDKTYSLLPGRLPRVWIAQGTYITNFNTQRGGVNFGMNAQPPLTIRNVQGFSLLSNTPICESVDGNGAEIWVGVRMNQGRSSILRYNFKGDTIGEYNHLNTSALPNGFFPNAIHFDKNGYKWVGLREGGLRILTPGNEWITMNAASLFPAGTQINHNAITSDDLGNVYIGTSNGLIIFKSPDYFGTQPSNPNDYSKLTTNEGLVNNVVRGMAFDKKYKRLIIATAGGVSFLRTRPDKIVGTVFNTSAGLDDGSRLSSDLKKSTPPIGFTVKLLKGSTIVDEKNIQGTSVYELDNANDEDTYSIEISYPRKNSKTMVYSLGNIRNQTFVPPTLVPDLLLTELDSLKPKLAQQCFELSAIFGIKLPKTCKGGFNVSQFENAGNRFRESDNLTENETEQLNNLANYLTVLQAANKMGALSAEIEAEGWVNLLELIQYAIEQLAFGQSLKDYVPADKNPLFESGLTEEGLKIMVGNLKILKEGTTVTLKKVVSKYPGNAEVKKNLEVALTIVSDAIDILINLVESGKNRSVFETLFAQLKKLLAQQLVAVSHEEFYLKQRHSNLVPLTSNQSLQKVSDLDFSTVFDNVYRPGGESLVGVAQNQLDEKKKQIETAVSISNVAGSAADISEAASALALIPGGQVAGGIFRSLAYGAKLVKGSALLTGTSIGLLGSSEIRDSSLKIRPRAGFNNGGGGDGPVQAIMLGQSLLAHGVLSEADSITARTVRLNQHLAQLNVFYQSGTWQPVPFGNAYKAWRKADSLLGEAIYGGLLQIQPYLSEAFLNVNGFETFYNTTVDSFLDKRTHLNRALFYRSLAWMHVNNPATESAGLDSLVDELTALNDTLANRLAIIIGQIANSSVEGDAYLEKISWAYNHTHAPGSNGSVRFTFKNVGPVTMQNVRFLLDPLSGGYTLTSPDSVFAGNIAPGDTIQFTFQFTSPQTDSIGRYKVMVKANNGRTPEVSGSLIVVNPNKVFSIRDGNWSDASTWHNGMVPLPSNDVQVGHKVKANQNITCKSLTVTIYGELQIDPGKTVIIQQ